MVLYWTLHESSLVNTCEENPDDFKLVEDGTREDKNNVEKVITDVPATFSPLG